MLNFRNATAGHGPATGSTDWLASQHQSRFRPEPGWPRANSRFRQSPGRPEGIRRAKVGPRQWFQVLVRCCGPGARHWKMPGPGPGIGVTAPAIRARHARHTHVQAQSNFLLCVLSHHLHPTVALGRFDAGYAPGDSPPWPVQARLGCESAPGPKRDRRLVGAASGWE